MQRHQRAAQRRWREKERWRWRGGAKTFQNELRGSEKKNVVAPYPQPVLPGRLCQPRQKGRKRLGFRDGKDQHETWCVKHRWARPCNMQVSLRLIRTRWWSQGPRVICTADACPTPPARRIHIRRFGATDRFQCFVSLRAIHAQRRNLCASTIITVETEQEI